MTNRMLYLAGRLGAVIVVRAGAQATEVKRAVFDALCDFHQGCRDHYQLAARRRHPVDGLGVVDWTVSFRCLPNGQTAPRDDDDMARLARVTDRLVWMGRVDPVIKPSQQLIQYARRTGGHHRVVA